MQNGSRIELTLWLRAEVNNQDIEWSRYCQSSFVRYGTTDCSRPFLRLVQRFHTIEVCGKAKAARASPRGRERVMISRSSHLDVLKWVIGAVARDCRCGKNASPGIAMQIWTSQAQRSSCERTIVRTSAPRPFALAPIPSRSCCQVIDIQHVNAFPYQSPPYMIPQSAGPVRSVPIAHLETSLVSLADLRPDELRLGARQPTPPDMAYGSPKGHRAVEAVARIKSAAGGCSSMHELVTCFASVHLWRRFAAGKACLC